jgi:hypothetical protein
MGPPLPGRVPRPVADGSTPRITRPAVGADLPAIRVILAAHDNDTPVPPGGVDVVGPYLDHLLAHHRALVVEEAGVVVAFGATLETGRARMLTDLFVAPDRLGSGIGRPLLGELLAGASACATFASADPRALALYVRAGMTPTWISLYVEGLPGRLPDPISSIDVHHASAGECAALERSWTGDDRSVDWKFWASMPAADTFVVVDAGGPVAVGAARAKQVVAARALDRLALSADAKPVPVVVAALCRAARGGRVQACVLGPSPVLPVLLDAGFEVVDQDQLMLSDPGLVDPVRLLPNPGML